ncbi:unnamed protein product, partial [Rotaria sordida]
MATSTIPTSISPVY